MGMLAFNRPIGSSWTLHAIMRREGFHDFFFLNYDMKPSENRGPVYYIQFVFEEHESIFVLKDIEGMYRQEIKPER